MWFPRKTLEELNIRRRGARPVRASIHREGVIAVFFCALTDETPVISGR